MNEFKIVIAETEQDFIDFEKGIYRNFYERDQNNWIAKNYKIIDNCRLQPLMPYTSQTVLIGKINNKLIAGVSINYDINNLDINKCGFKIPEGETNYCEGLLVYQDQNLENPFEIGVKMHSFMIDIAREKGYSSIFGTCAEKIKRLYEVFRWKFVYAKEEIDNKYDEKYLLKYFL